ncbi:MAG: PIN domain-containing protein [Candidatus Sulfotelmatobacter sp.]
MLVLVDTSIWSLALRRMSTDLNLREQRLTAALRELIRDGRAQILGPVRQELLSGIRQESSFRKLRDQLRAFDEPHIEAADYEQAAHISNQCRSRGIAGSAIDFLICAVASRRDWQVFTTDHDFTRYASAIHLDLYRVN